MSYERENRLVAAIYDAAADAQRWDAALVTLAETLGCVQAALEIFDPTTGPIALRRPLIAPAYLEAFDGYYRERSDLRARTGEFAAGAVFRSQDVMDLDAVRTSTFYNEWWLPQGTGGDVLMANVVREARATAILTAVKPAHRPDFTADEQRLFGLAVDHAMRAIAINRRIRLAEARADVEGPPAGFAIFDRNGALLSADADTRRLLSEAFGDLCVRTILAGRHGVMEHRSDDGSNWRVRAVPLAERESRDWLDIDRPAVLVHLERPADVRRMQGEQLRAVHGLSAAEAAVAIEIGQGDGRAAVAARLGIRATTVRAHLSAIFDKTGVRRQAELVRLVQAI